MKNAFNRKFGDSGNYVCEGDTITAEVEGFTVKARIERDDSVDRPDQRDDGFWPSLDPKAAGYIGDGKGALDLAKAKAKADAIMKAWKADQWFYCGVVLSVSRSVSIKGRVQNEVTISDHAASLWGIECNYPESDNAYLTEVANELLPEAIAHAKECLKQISA